MNWQKRLLDIALAGGVAGGVLTGLGACLGGIPPCNANPDPCCADPSGKACRELKACVKNPDEACCAKFVDDNEQISHACTKAGFGDTTSSATPGGGGSAPDGG